VKRRKFVALMGGLLAAPCSLGQKPQKVPVLGVLTPHSRAMTAQAPRSPVREALKKFGWVVGENLELERPDAEGKEDRLPAMAEELVRKRVDVIWAVGPEAAVAAARATRAIPIVFWGVGYPIEQGLIDSFARPGRNVTGIAFFTGPEVSTKILELLKEIAPSAKRVAMISTPSAMMDVKGNRFVGVRPVFEAAVKHLGLESRLFEITRAEDIDGVLASILKSRAQSLVVPGTTLTFRERQRFVDFASRNRLPAAYNQRQFVESGGLFSYGIDSVETQMQSITYVDHILRGARPANLPVELPSKYQLIINRKTAHALGLKVPQSMLARADRVIE
jgi:putative tryptophan/tyrosine transport system substrate-binding protein